jgi:predicted outer membrane repeat protein
MARNGGALFLSGAVVSAHQTTFRANVALGSGGSIFALDTRLLIADQSLIADNHALNGNSLFVASGSVTYAMPAPLGHWVANALQCRLFR